MIGLFLSDVRRKQEILAEQGYRVSWLRILMSDGSSANFLYRATTWCQDLKLLPAVFLLQWFNRVINGCVIGAGARFGAGFVLMHPVGVVINSKVKGDENVTIESGVVIGDEKGRAPELGARIFVGAGAKIIGGVKVGSDVNIGANAVVVKDVPSRSTAVGIPARLIQR